MIILQLSSQAGNQWPPPTLQSSQSQMPIHQHRNVINSIQENMSLPRINNPTTAGPEYLSITEAQK